MKLKVSQLLLFAFLYSCESKNYDPNELIGVWNNSYEVQTQDSEGKWSDWTQINTLVALPQLEFTADGKILWDGKTPSSCCLYGSYKLEKDKIQLLDPTNSELCDCLFCSNWTIEKLDNDILELNVCYSKVRYTRAK